MLTILTCLELCCLVRVHRLRNTFKLLHIYFSHTVVANNKVEYLIFRLALEKKTQT